MTDPGPTPPPAGAVDAAVELYALPPGRFTAARDARAKAARAAGDRALAAAVRALRRPSVAAWAVNVLVRERPDDVEALLATGALLRAAQAAMDGPALRDLTARRHEGTAALRAAADDLTAAAGQRLTEPVAAALEGTLRAAMADPGAAAALRTGLLTSELVSTGFEPVDVAGAVAVPGAPPLLAPPVGAPEPVALPDPADDVRVTLGPRSRPRPRAGARRTRDPAVGPRDRSAGAEAGADAHAEADADADADVARQRRAAERDAHRRAQERHAAEREVARAEAVAVDADASWEAAEALVADLTRQHIDLSRQVEALMARLAEAREEEGAAARARQRAQVDRDAAAQAVERARHGVRTARERLDALEGPAGPGPGDAHPAATTGD